jgi:hypothetical protein
VTINDGGEMGPALLPTRNMRHVHSPAFTTPTGVTHPAMFSRPRGTRPLMDQPPFLPQHAIHRFIIHAAGHLPTRKAQRCR